MFYSEQTHCSNLTAACLGLLDRSQMIKVTNTARRHWCRSPQSQKKKKKEPQMLSPVRFTFSFSKRLPLCLIWRFWSTDRFIYSAAGKGPLHSFARGDKATADCHSNSMLNTFPPKLVELRQRSPHVDILPRLCESHSVAFTLLKKMSIQQLCF